MGGRAGPEIFSCPVEQGSSLCAQIFGLREPQGTVPEAANQVVLHSFTTVQGLSLSLALLLEVMRVRGFLAPHILVVPRIGHILESCVRYGVLPYGALMSIFAGACLAPDWNW